MNSKIFSVIITLLFFSPLGAFAQSYPTCSLNTTKKLLDEFCPKLEGQTLPRCCPDKNVSLSCNFYKPGTFQTASVGSAGCPATPCCNTGTGTCSLDSISANQTAKVNFRNGACCATPCVVPPGYVEGSAGACSNNSDQVCPPGMPSCDSVPNNCPTSPGTGPNPPPPPPDNPPAPPVPPVPPGGG